MADNGHFKNINNNGITESDAIHHRLRDDLHPKKYYICRSCNLRFEGTSLMQIYEHFGENEHINYFSLCLYCQGKVHQYYEEKTRNIQIYHNCLRWRRGEDK